MPFLHFEPQEKIFNFYYILNNNKRIVAFFINKMKKVVAKHMSGIKRIALIVPMLTMAMTLLAQHDFAARATSGQTLYYKFLNDYEVAVTFADDGGDFPYLGYQKPEGNLVIPYKVKHDNKEYVVRQIGERAFKACVKLKSVTIPSTVESIGNRAFYFCDALVTVVLPSSIESIGDKAFDVCFSLDEATKKAVGIETPTFRRRTPSELNIDLPASISVDGRKVTIDGGLGKVADLYDTQGRKVMTMQCDQDITTLSLPSAGTYMLKVGDESFRVVAK